MDKIDIKIASIHENQTIKEFLKANNIGRGKVEEIRTNKLSLINGEYKTIETKLKENDVLTILFEEKVDFLPLNEILDVVYEDDYILIVNKPINMIIHPDDKTKSGTLVNLVANYYLNNNINRKVRFIHRIDKETSGLVIFVKDFYTEALLLKQMQNNTLKRTYLAFVEGTFNFEKGTIKANIGEDRHNKKKMCISTSGKEAITNYKIISKFQHYSLVEFTLQTGRTHQIRVHSSYLKHPLLGDVLYGGNKIYIDRVALHSYKVNFIHPIINKNIDVLVDLPYDMKILIEK